MIVFDLTCDNGHSFEGWFGSSGDYTFQKERGLVTCPDCGSDAVSKAPMAPSVGRKGNQQAVSPAQAPVPRGSANEDATAVASGPMPAEVQHALKMLAEAQTRALKDSKWVGNKFVEESRAMHYGERDMEAIHGEASLEDAQSLVEEGIEVAPLPFPVAPPKDLN